MKRLLLFSGFLIFAFIHAAVAQSPPAVPLTIFRDNDSLTIYVPGDDPVSLRELTLQTTTLNGDSITFRVQAMPAFVKLDFSSIEAPTCFRFERAGSDTPLPLECQQISASSRYVQLLNDADLFWYDRTAHVGRLVMVLRRDVPYGLCPAEVAECPISYVPPEETPPPDTAAQAKGPVVLIANFDQTLATTPVNIAQRLETDLEKRLRENRLQGVTIKVVPVVSSEEEAQALLTNEEASAIVWGWYDDLGINVRVFLASGDHAIDEVPAVGEIPLGMTDSPNSELAFVVRNVLPENVSFVSMFVIGHLRYRANNYQDGHDAFDAAMNSIPENVSLENEALVHFFNGRQLIESGSTDYTTAICEYAQAIDAQPDFAEAYNNLGIVFSMLDQNESFSDEASQCLNENENLCYNAQNCFQQAQDLQPDNAVYELNNLTIGWRNGFAPDSSQIEALLERDPSLAGAYVMVGNLKREADDLQGAVEAYESALALKPDWLEVQMNLAQAYLNTGDLDGAQQILDAVVQAAPDNDEANLARANLAAMRGNNEEALLYLDRIPPLTSDPDLRNLRSTAHTMRTLIFAATGQMQSAIEELYHLQQFLPPYSSPLNQPWSSFHNYLLGLLFSDYYDQQAGLTIWYLVDQSYHDLLSPGFSIQQDNTTSLAWYKLVKPCTNDRSTSNIDVANACLPSDLSGRIDALYAAFRDALTERINYRQGIVFGAACPYVFTWDGTAWTMDTTILYKQVGQEAEAIQLRVLRHFDGRLLIREVEPETSYIDHVTIQIVDGSGQTHILTADVPELHDSDDDYWVLNQGDEILLKFAGFEDIADIRDVQVVAEGYYVPYEGKP